MTQYLKNKTAIPNWLMTIIVGAAVTMFAGGWVKIDNMEEEIVKLKEAKIYRKEQIQRIENKLDQVLTRLRDLEKK